MKKTALVVAAAVVVGSAIFAFSGCGGTKVEGVPDTVATVNGQKISSADYLKALHTKMGQSELQNLIQQEILIQWAKDEEVPVTDKQIEDQIGFFKKIGIYQDWARNVGEDTIRQEFESRQAQINLSNKYIEISDDELEQFYESVKTGLAHGPRKYVAIAMASKRSKLNDLKKAVDGGKDFDEATLEYADSPSMTRGPLGMWVEDGKMAMSEEISKAAEKTKVGKVSAVFNASGPGQPTQYAILKVVEEQKKSEPKYDDVKQQVKDLAVFQKSQMDPEFQKEFNERKKKAKIEINLADYKGIVKQFQNPPEPMMMGAPQPAPQPAPEEAPKNDKK